MPMVEKSAQNV